MYNADRRGRDRYNYLCNQCLSSLKLAEGHVTGSGVISFSICGGGATGRHVTGSYVSRDRKSHDWKGP